MTPLPETPLEAIDGTVRERVFLEGWTVLLDRPANSDRLVDHPAVKEALLAREVMPYWADLWPAARMLAKWLLKREFAPGTPALELGCGLGLGGIAGLSRGLRVTFSDHDATALRFAARNARLNGFAGFDTLQMDWNAPPEGLSYPVILAADLTYEARNVAPLVALIKRVLAPEGTCWLTDQDRLPAALLRGTLAGAGLPFTTETLRAGEPGGRRLKGTLYAIRHG
ncbi:MAG: methyltransferase domain-containing protein [Gemmataceae bacterium]|nr:methyltransferase domain-containing protein [Gemmataceae bacterium]